MSRKSPINVLHKYNQFLFLKNRKSYKDGKITVYKWIIIMGKHFSKDKALEKLIDYKGQIA